VQEPMVVFGESETSEIVANYHQRDLRIHVIILRLAHKSGALFRRSFVTPRKSDFNKLWLIRYSRRFAFKRTQKCTWLMRTSLNQPVFNLWLIVTIILRNPFESLQTVPKHVL
jgi:hypothetical protein